jgi:hypothetical protein
LPTAQPRSRVRRHKDQPQGYTVSGTCPQVREGRR